MDYKLLVFISKEHLSSIYISEIGDSDYISLEGNQVVEYSNRQDLDQFLQCIKDNFNIDHFSDINLSVIILNFEAEQSMISYLFNSLNGVCAINIIDPAILLPAILPKYSTVDPLDDYYTLTSFGVIYKLIVDDDYNCVCTEKNVDVNYKSSIEIPLEEYKNFLIIGTYLYDEKHFQEIIKEHQLELSKIHAEKQELLEGIKHLEKAKEDECNIAKKKIKELTLKLQKFEQSTSRSIYRFDQQKIDYFTKRSSFDTFTAWEIYVGRLTYYVQYVSSDGNRINCGETICEITKFNNGQRIDRFLVKAESSGRVFHLCRNGCVIKDGDYIAVIGFNFDSRSEALAWYEQNELN